METESDFSYMEHLPEEVLIEIFSYFSPKLLKIATLVCARWNGLVETTPELMKNFNLNLISGCSHIKQLSSVKRRFQHATVANLTKPFRDVLAVYKIRSLELVECCVTKQDLIASLEQMKLLEALSFENIRFEDLQKDLTPVQLKHLSSLKTSEVEFLDLISTTTLKSFTLNSRMNMKRPEAVAAFLNQQPILEKLEILGVYLNIFLGCESILTFPFRLKSLIVGRTMIMDSTDEMIRFLRIQSTLEELKIESPISDLLQTFIYKEMTQLKSLALPNFQSGVNPNVPHKLLEKLTRLETAAVSKNSIDRPDFLRTSFPSLISFSVSSTVSENVLMMLLIQLSTMLPQLQSLSVPNVTRGASFRNLKELQVAQVKDEWKFNAFLEQHKSSLEKLTVGWVDGAAFSRGLTIEAIKSCKNLKHISFTTDSPLVTRMFKAIKRDHPWTFETKFKKPNRSAWFPIIFKFPDDQAVFEEKCRTWDDQLIREFSSVESYGLNSFVNMFK